MATIIIDGKSYEVNNDTNLLDAILSLGLDLPYFCWHPALDSVGACRQCAIKMYKDETDTRGKIVMACMEPVTDGARISINDPEVRQFRATVIEWLMSNHPHDCPICDEGGECHLQDMTVMTGHVYRRHRFHKRTYRNQYLGPFINHEMNRCIQCYRCTRFYRDYAGGRDLHAFAAHNHVYFGRHAEGVLENEFSGNLVEICPTGVFTDKTLKQHYTRKWDFTNAPSVCHECGLGCNIIVSERYGSLRRIYSRYNGKVNGYFICDRGRFGYEFVNNEHRLREPLLRDKTSGKLAPVDKANILEQVGKMLSESEKCIGIGSPTASLESNFALRTLVGETNFYQGISQKESTLIASVIEILTNSPVRTPSLKETEQADAILILGEDLTNTAPMLALSLRQATRQIQMDIADQLDIPRWHDAAVREAAQDAHSPLFIATPHPTKLDDIAAQTYRAAPDDIARMGFAVANALDENAPQINGLSEKMRDQVEEIAGALKNAKKPLVVSGVHVGSEAVLRAAANVATALHGINQSAELCFALPEPNSLGLSLMTDQRLESTLERVRYENIDTVIVLENDLYLRAGKEQIDQFLNKCKHLVVLNYLENKTTSAAEVMIPVGTFAESDGTLVNNEGRAQRFYQVFPSEGNIQDSWRWLKQMIDAAGRKEAANWAVLDDVTKALSRDLPIFNSIETNAPPPGFRIAGQKIPRASYRYSGRTAMNAHKNVHEPKPAEDPDSPLSFTMEGYHGKPPSSLISLYWSAGWNSAQSINKYQIEVGGPLHGGDPGHRLIEPKPDVRPFYFEEIPNPFQSRQDALLFVPVYHIFGSEPFSMYTPALAERAPEPYLQVNPDDGKEYKLKEGMEVSVHLGENKLNLPVRFKRMLPKGLAVMPVGLSRLPTMDLPEWGKISGVEK